MRPFEVGPQRPLSNATQVRHWSPDRTLHRMHLLWAQCHGLVTGAVRDRFARSDVRQKGRGLGAGAGCGHGASTTVLNGHPPDVAAGPPLWSRASDGAKTSWSSVERSWSCGQLT